MIDGTGAAPRRADVMIASGRIVEIGEGLDDDGEVLDATGLMVAPGFIDMHSHADFTLPAFPEAMNSLSQGVTTEVMGNCGFSPAPLSHDADRNDAFQASCAAIGPDLDWQWSSFASYLDRLDAAGPPVNCVTLVGHGAIRCAVMGFEDRPPSLAELEVMQALVGDAVRAGAWGLSSGLVYAPGTYADPAELVELAAVVARHDGLYSSHIRNEGDGLLPAIAEALDVGRTTGVRVEISHLKASGPANHGRVGEALALIDDARDTGVLATADAYPYTAGSTVLAALIPPWAQEGGFEVLIERLRSTGVRERLRAEMLTGLPGWQSNLVACDGWEGVLISSVLDRRLAGYEGLSVSELAARARVDPFEFTFDLLIEDRAGTAMVVFQMAERDMHDALRHPRTVAGSDQLLVTGADRKVHPRAYGCHSRILGPLVRDAGLFPIETAVHKMTGLPASVLGLGDRGLVGQGMVADLVLFDPDIVSDRATYAQPNLPAVGIERVLIAGEVAYRPGSDRRRRLGRVLRRA